MSKFIPNSFQVPNVLVDEYITELSSHSFKLLMFIIRKTVGWQKEKDSISTTQLAKVLGVKKLSNVYPYVKELEALRLIKTHKSLGKTNQYSLSKNFLKPVPKKGTTKSESSPKKGEYPVPKKGTTTSPKKGDSTKDTDKTTNKKSVYQKFDLSGFDDFEKEIAMQVIDYRKSINSPLKTIAGVKGRVVDIQDVMTKHKLTLKEVMDLMSSNEWKTIKKSFSCFEIEQPKKGTVDGMSDVKKARIQMRRNQINKMRLAS